ncbi:MAG: hypothetical protein CL760_03355 [Chloroflexi bacterium]|nr:hypothetical protein [Chloroflexota bacterium]MQG05537.1 hypothetical protein [SAR202 cluster bacterium]|tara:strand:- start:24716 stop:24910 length:195 start_codon:yes stop_codon:yes gene_type:complete
MEFSKTESIDSGLKFKTISNLMVETTGITEHLEEADLYVHEVKVLEGPGEGNTYLHNLDSAEQI